MTHNQIRTTMAEYAFLVIAAKYGIICCKSQTDGMPFDWITVHKRKLTRVQIKCARKRSGKKNQYMANNYMRAAGNGEHNRRNYTKDDVDIIAVYLIDVNIWYLLPVEAASSNNGTLRNNLYFSPTNEDSKSLTTLYREAWHLLLNEAVTVPGDESK